MALLGDSSSIATTFSLPLSSRGVLLHVAWTVLNAVSAELDATSLTGGWSESVDVVAPLLFLAGFIADSRTLPSLEGCGKGGYTLL